ncbi:hypothetical protein KHQ89_05435 [Mycoplasmatota bacterium]|nr:hypothetical protein KHQ89_05435 [Mycoplasmatota bacterium]
MFNELTKAISWIESQTKFKPKTDLSRMQTAYKMLDLDLSNIKKIHVAGTNGKGSTCAYLVRMSRFAKQKTGVFTSPYVVRFNERIGIGTSLITDEDLLIYINWIYDFNQLFSKSYKETLSFFELLTLMAIKYFYDQRVDVMIMEVGIGGLLDATNIINYDLSLITNIGYDHMRVLGNTLESIAKNKLGILKKGNHLITTVDPKLHDLFKSYAKDVGATIQFIDEKPVIESFNPLRIVYKDMNLYIHLKGIYQVKNAMLAIEAAQRLFPELTYLDYRAAFSKVKLPARLTWYGPGLYIDGAHNISAMKALGEHLKLMKSRRNISILFSCLADKDVNGMLDILEELSDRIIITEFPDARFKSLRSFVRPGMSYNEDAMNAYKRLILERDETNNIYILGSLHFASYMMKEIKKYHLEVHEMNERADRIERKNFFPEEDDLDV